MTRSEARSPLLTGLSIVAFSLMIPLLISCSQEPASIEPGWMPDAPAVYRVGVESGIRFGGPVSNLSGATDLTAALRVTPVSGDRAEVEILYLGASVADTSGEMVALSLPDVTGETLTVAFSPPGVVSGIEGGDDFLDLRLPLVSTEDVVRSVFPPLPEGSFRPGDTWTGGASSPFPNLGPEPVRMRYVLDSAGEEANISGYELSVAPRTFSTRTAGDEVSGEGSLNIDFAGTLDEQGGYDTTTRTSTFDSDFLRLGGGGYANGNLQLKQKVEIERLGDFEQFGLGVMDR